MFVGTKKQAQDPVRSYAEKCGMPYVNERWLGGMLTNFDTISKRVAKMLEYERMQASGEFDAMPKKEALLLTRELEKLQRNLGGLRGLTKRPDAIFVLDTKKEHIAVTEANKLGIPVVAVVDTNVDPELVQYPIPGNDDAIRANSLLARVIADAVEEGRFIAAKREPGGARRSRAPPSRRPRSTPSRPRPAARPRAAQAERERRLAAASAGDADDDEPTDGRRATADAAEPEPPSPRRRRARPRPTPTRPSAADAPPSRAAGRRAPTGRRADDRADAAERRPTSPRSRPSQRAERGELTAMAFTAKDVQALRQATGAGMMDAKRALEANDGDIEAAKQWLREQGLAASAKRDDRENTQGVVALVVDGQVGALVELKCETDFVAGSEQFKAEADDAGQARGRQGRRARVAEPPGRARRPEDHAQGEHRARPGRAPRGRRRARSLDSYLHIQGGRGVNGVLVVLAGGDTSSWPTTSPCTSPSPGRSTSPATRCPPTWSPPSAQTLETISRNEGKPEAALPKIVEGRMQGFFKDVVLLDQPYAKDDKQSIAQLLGDADDRRASPRSRSAET